MGSLQRSLHDHTVDSETGQSTVTTSSVRQPRRQTKLHDYQEELTDEEEKDRPNTSRRKTRKKSARQRKYYDYEEGQEEPEEDIEKPTQKKSTIKKPLTKKAPLTKAEPNTRFLGKDKGKNIKKNSRKETPIPPMNNKSQTRKEKSETKSEGGSEINILRVNTPVTPENDEERTKEKRPKSRGSVQRDFREDKEVKNGELKNGEVKHGDVKHREVKNSRKTVHKEEDGKENGEKVEENEDEKSKVKELSRERESSEREIKDEEKRGGKELLKPIEQTERKRKKKRKNLDESEDGKMKENEKRLDGSTKSLKETVGRSAVDMKTSEKTIASKKTQSDDVKTSNEEDYRHRSTSPQSGKSSRRKSRDSIKGSAVRLQQKRDSSASSGNEDTFNPVELGEYRETKATMARMAHLGKLRDMNVYSGLTSAAEYSPDIRYTPSNSARYPINIQINPKLHHDPEWDPEDYEVFICHSSKDSVWVQGWIKDPLQAHRYTTKSNIDFSIEEMWECRRVIVVCTQDLIDNKKLDVSGMSFSEEQCVVLIKLKDCDLPETLLGDHVLDLTSVNTHDLTMQQPFALRLIQKLDLPQSVCSV